NTQDGLIHLIKRIELIDGVKSARILYLYPSTTTLKLIKTIGDSKVFHNYFDMPIQHINDDMLRIMKRGFGKAKTLELLNAMKALPNAFIRTSFIVGHPQESEAMFEEMVAFAGSFGFDRLNVFSYSDEEGTSAYTMEEKIAPKVINARAKKLGKIASNVEVESLQKLVGQEISLIIDGESYEHEFLLSARALNWAPDVDGEIYVNDREIEGELSFGKIYHARITELAQTRPLATVTGNV
ncbi:MAG: 30S ribosomal protein S12 methylthiotransferase RimO, partial [Sulfuricurvum sp.]|uniref:radical SAM protein n=1 Tax=Sulfuricurvum sp. TaxID=2025608 RepID=UPI00275525EF|nr:30S ribosomal protein S12 methylthiotransferase RimO [Sulfuricurvum sp.]